jgi:hypothetical protein
LLLIKPPLGPKVTKKGSADSIYGFKKESRFQKICEESDCQKTGAQRPEEDGFHIGQEETSGGEEGFDACQEETCGGEEGALNAQAISCCGQNFQTIVSTKAFQEKPFERTSRRSRQRW